MKYYFLAASLPRLALGEPPPISPAEFRDLCARHLAPLDRAALAQLLEDGPGPVRHPFVREWREADRLLRNATARQRAARRKTDPAPFLREPDAFDVRTERDVHEAFAVPDPLARERKLDAVRWRRADELAQWDPFSSRAVLAYALRLALAARWAGLDADAGRERASRVVHARPRTEEEQPRGAPASPDSRPATE